MSSTLASIDRELRSVARDVNHLIATDCEGSTPRVRRVAVEQSRILKSHISLMKMLQDLNTLHRHCEEEWATQTPGGMNQAILYWLQTLAQKTFQLYDQRNQVARRAMWAKILERRVKALHAGDDILMQEETLAAAQQGNAKLERELMMRRQISEMAETERQLDGAIVAAEVKLANRAAGSTFMVLLGRPETCWEHHLMKALGLTLKNATWHLRIGVSLERLAEIQAQLLSESEGALNRYRSTMIERFLRRGATKDREQDASTQQRLREMRAIVRQRMRTSLNELPAPLSPRILSVSPLQDQ